MNELFDSITVSQLKNLKVALNGDTGAFNVDLKKVSMIHTQGPSGTRYTGLEVLARLNEIDNIIKDLETTKDTLMLACIKELNLLTVEGN